MEGAIIVVYKEQLQYEEGINEKLSIDSDNCNESQKLSGKLFGDQGIKGIPLKGKNLWREIHVYTYNTQWKSALGSNEQNDDLFLELLGVQNGGSRGTKGSGLAAGTSSWEKTPN